MIAVTRFDFVSGALIAAVCLIGVLRDRRRDRVRGAR